MSKAVRSGEGLTRTVLKVVHRYTERNRTENYLLILLCSESMSLPQRFHHFSKLFSR